MQEAREKRIRENLTALVDLTSNVEDVLKVLKDKDIVNEDEEEKILNAGSPFDKKAQLYWLITKKDDTAFDTLIAALRSTGNGEAADKIQDGSHVVNSEVDVTAESNKSQNHDGIGFDTEKEFERIQSEVESKKEVDQPEETPESVIASALVSEVFEEALEKAYDQPEVTIADSEVLSISDEDDVESEVRVEVTPPPESDREVDEDDKDNSAEPTVDVSVTEVLADSEDWTKVQEPEVAVEEPKPTEKELEVVSEVIETDEPPVKEARKQVKFESPKEFIIKKDESEESDLASEASISPNSKSLVQQNREKFEQHAPAGVKVKYSFRKNNEAAVEEPKESTVKNLRNFFQKLGSSVDKEDVNTRSGTKLGGVHPNRKSMAS